MTRCKLALLFLTCTSVICSEAAFAQQSYSGEWTPPDAQAGKQTPSEASTAWGFWKADGMFYSGRVTRSEGGLRHFQFDDGDAAWLPAEEITHFDVEPGNHVHVDWLGKGSYYPAKVLSNSGGRLRVQYDEDGTIESTTIRHVRLRLVIDGMLTSGRRVFARWSPDGKFYPGTIRERRESSWLIEYDDGVTEWLEFADLSLLTVHGQMWLECRWLGGKLYYPAKVLFVRGEKVRVQYEDGTLEDTSISMLRQTLTNGRK